MLSLTIFAAAASAATQTAPATVAVPAEPPFARRPENVVMPDRPEVRRFFTEWGFAEAVIDGDRVWLSGVVAGLRQGETMADSEAAYDRAWKMLGDVLKRFKKACDNAKLRDAMKRVAHYETPSDRARRKRGAQARRAAAALSR